MLLVIFSIDCRNDKIDVLLCSLFRDESLFLCEIFILVEVMRVVLETFSVSLFLSILDSVEKLDLTETRCTFLTLLTDCMIPDEPFFCSWSFEARVFVNAWSFFYEFVRLLFGSVLEFIWLFCSVWSLFFESLCLFELDIFFLFKFFRLNSCSLASEMVL